MFEVNKALVQLNGTMAVQLINFLVLLWLMNRLLIKPIRRVIDERETRISSWIEEASDHNAQMTGMIEEYNSVIESNTREVHACQEELKERVKEEITREVSAAQDKASNLVADAEEDLIREVEKVREELMGRAEDLAREVVSKILGRAAA